MHAVYCMYIQYNVYSRNIVCVKGVCVSIQEAQEDTEDLSRKTQSHRELYQRLRDLM